MLPAILPPSPETIAFMAALADDEADFQSDVMQARRYDSGRQFVALTERLRQFLGGDTANDQEDWKRLRLNVCRIILSAVVDRLIVAGFDTDEAPQEEAALDERGQPTTRLVKPVAAWAWRVWQANRMDAKQRRVHEMALRDSEAFVIVDWDNNSARPRFTPHQRFVDATLDGDGDGCIAYYRNDDPDQDLLFVVKRWTEVGYPNGRRTTRQRMTIYLPGEIRKYAGHPGAWRPTVDADTEPWPIPWTDASGAPLGIPVAHFRSSAGMEAREAWPLQNAINKALVDLMQESDIAAFRIIAAFGWEPIVPGSKTAANPGGTPLPIEPGTWVGTKDPNGKIQAIEGAALDQFLALIDALILRAAMVTDTPTSRFVFTRQVSSEGAQKETQTPLLNKARNRQSELGDGWESALSIARRLENTFGRGGLPEDVLIQTQWVPLESRDETEELARAKLRKELGMPIRIIAAELGMPPDQVSLWEEEAGRRQAEMTAAREAQAQTFGGARDEAA